MWSGLILNLALVFDPKSGMIFEMIDEIRREQVWLEEDAFYDRLYCTPLARDTFECVDWSKLTTVEICHTNIGIDPVTLVSDPSGWKDQYPNCVIKINSDMPAGLKLDVLTDLYEWAVRVVERRRVPTQLAEGLHSRLSKKSPLNVLDDTLVFVISRLPAC
jgi:hypothetical protein